jgi:hypothetical protein
LAFGWTLEYIDNLPWPDVAAMMEFFLEEPPVHMLVAGFLGYKARGQKPELSEVEQRAQSGRLPGFGARSMKELPPYLRDFVEEMKKKEPDA